MFLEYKNDGNKENLASANIKNKSRQWKMKKSKSTRKNLPFSSVLNTPESFKSKRKSSYTPSIKVSKWDFEPLDKRLEERGSKISKGEMKVLKELRDLRTRDGRFGTGGEEMGREFVAVGDSVSLIIAHSPLGFFFVRF